MTAITFDKTWAVDEIHITYQVSVADSAKEVLLQIKNLMKSHNWTHFASCDRDSVSTDPGTDLWITKANLILSATVAHSWIVLKNTAIAPNFQVCFDLNHSSLYNYMTCVVSYNAGFTGGTTTARPTATDETAFASPAIIWMNAVPSSSGTNITYYYSSDFKCNRVYISSSTSLEGAAYTSFIFDVPKDPVSWWDQPFVAGIYNRTHTYTNFCNTTGSTKLYTKINGTICNLALGSWGTTAAYGINPYCNSTDYNGSFILSPMPIISVEPTRIGIIGTMYDLYWSGDKIPHGSYMTTAAGSNTLYVYTNWAQPNDGNIRFR